MLAGDLPWDNSFDPDEPGYAQIASADVAAAETVPPTTVSQASPTAITGDVVDSIFEPDACKFGKTRLS